MEAGMRKQWSPEDKVRIALAAVKGEMTMAEISSKYEAHCSQITKWKAQLLGGLRGIFSKGNLSMDRLDTRLTDELYKQIGQLRVENEWLKKKSDLFNS